jgi:epoxyqueuosine reductase
MLTAAAVRQRALATGFDLCGIAPAVTVPGAGRIREWIGRGYAGDMGYLPRSARTREDVRRCLPSARSVIVTGTLYHVDRPRAAAGADADRALISRCAWGADYHEVIGRRLDRLLDWMHAEHGAPFEARVCVDTAPVHERAYAQLSGVGWIGRNGCVINPRLGSWILLGEIVTSLALAPDVPAAGRCGQCTRCLDACPTGALVEPQVLDARRCISYLTVESRREIPQPLRAPVGRRIFGCDRCQEVCPWNRSAPRSHDPSWLPRAGLDSPRLSHLWRRSDDELERLRRGTPMARLSAAAFRRNLAVALANAGPARGRQD